MKNYYKNSYPETWDECLARHPGREEEARAVYKNYEKSIDKTWFPDARFVFAMEILDLQNAGYPAERLAAILTREQWSWVSQLKSAIEKYRMEEIKKS